MPDGPSSIPALLCSPVLPAKFRTARRAQIGCVPRFIVFGAYKEEHLVANHDHHSTTSASTRTNIQQLRYQVVKFGVRENEIVANANEPLLDLFTVHFNV
jgi:hypothetical protein